MKLHIPNKYSFLYSIFRKEVFQPNFISLYYHLYVIRVGSSILKVNSSKTIILKPFWCNYNIYNTIGKEDKIYSEVIKISY